MKAAIVHDYLNQYGGAERVLEAFHELFPGAPVFTIVYDRKALPQFRDWDIRPSFVQKMPFAKSRYRNFAFLFPKAARSFNLKGFDLVISSTHAWGKGIDLDRGACHICYCLTPMRYIWDLHEDYLKHEHINPVIRAFLPLLAGRMRRWDVATSQTVKYYIAISETVARRIKDYYKRDSIIIYPPCDTDFFRPTASPVDEGYYLTVSRLKAYKRIDILIEAFNILNLPLKIVGAGAELSRLKRMTNENIEFVGHVEDERLVTLYQNCKAFVFAGHEDFGLTMAEAQACGKPVIAYAKGGAQEIVIERKTGLFFYEQAPEALLAAVKEFRGLKFDYNFIREQSLRFKKETFKGKMRQFIKDKSGA